MENIVDPLPQQPAVASPVPANDFKLAGLWRRVFAFVLDTIIVAIPLGIVAAIYSDQVMRLGPWGHLVGFAILLVYFAVLDSRLGKGQSLGKKILKIRVIQKNGDFLPVKETFLRTILVLLPAIFNGWSLPGVPLQIGTVVSSIVFAGLGLALAYSFLFARKSRQALHDFISGSYVVQGNYLPDVLQDTTAKQRTIVYGVGVVGLVLVIVAYFALPEALSSFLGSQRVASMLGIVNAINREPGIYNAGVMAVSNKYNSFTGGERQSWKELEINASVNKSCSKYPEDCKSAMRRIAKIALDKIDNRDQFDYMNIQLTYGYDLGIVHGAMSFGNRLTMDEWEQAVQLGFDQLTD